MGKTGPIKCMEILATAFEKSVLVRFRTKKKIQRRSHGNETGTERPGILFPFRNNRISLVNIERILRCMILGVRPVCIAHLRSFAKRILGALMLCLRHAMNAPFSSPPCAHGNFSLPAERFFQQPKCSPFFVRNPHKMGRVSLRMRRDPALSKRKEPPPLSFTASTVCDAPGIAGRRKYLFLVFMCAPAHRKQVEGELVYALGFIVQPSDFEQFLSEFARFHLEQVECGV